MGSKIIKAKNLTLGYKKDEPIIKESSFSIESQSFVFVTGPSGSGKSTLIKSLYGALQPQSGILEIGGIKINNIKRKFLIRLRQNLGIIFQDYKLINEWTVKKNVMLPLLIAGHSKDVCETQTKRLLRHVKLSNKAFKYPYELSGGEQQRVAIARALAHNPIIILADEPTGNLDEYSSNIIWNLLIAAKEQLKATVLVVTHHIPTNIHINFKHFHIEDGILYEIS
ncbi:cell division ATP-binding protein FtsE [Nitrosophilus kaiyonis]|uniref:cell division ATP-binding protein FtsE n=1 Tax=Nitrosophilus kaiyonis TaxID=2930200 RepID=UPI0024926766|nr:ABC transporter ATP-binding protein [Nitrosophilus kaiyonis]